MRKFSTTVNPGHLDDGLPNGFSETLEKAGGVMGQAKREWEEYHDRGWSAPDKVVCQNCVEDDFLKNLILNNANACRCDYCGRRSRGFSAAPVESIMPAVASALNYLYAEPTAAGVPYDGGWVVEPTYTADALMGIPFNGHDDLFEDIADSFSNTAWVSAAEGHWTSSHNNDDWSWAWQSFTNKVKHQCRYFFAATDNDDGGWEALEPFDVLALVGKIAGQLNLLACLPEKSTFFRVRERLGDADWSISDEQLGAPPSQLANAGRMNPAGISYLYLSKTQEGALAEVLHGPPCQAVVAQFETLRSLAVLDLTHLPPLPSVFDSEQHRIREAVLFLNDFVADICRPVQKDGREHISYVPSQIVSEYFSQIFRTPNNAKLDGIVYPSAISLGSVNLTLFPLVDSHTPFGHSVKFVGGTELSLATWNEFSSALSSQKQ